MDVVMDWEREGRTGVAEAVFCVNKSAAQLDRIVETARRLDKRLLLTRLEAPNFAALDAGIRGALDYDAVSRTAILGGALAAAPSGVGIVAAGTSDLAVAAEAGRTLAFAGHGAPIIADVGVAGLWRLIERSEELRGFRIVIAVAGMEGALFSVVAGLVEAPVIAVPTSVGYGVAAEGRTALHAALASCAPGVTAVNIDNGFGAAAAALKMLRLARSPEACQLPRPSTM